MQYERWSPPRIDPLRASLLSLRAVLNRCAGTSEAWRCIKANQFFFSILSFLCCERKTFQRLSLLLSFVFSFGKLSSVPWEWWLLRARYRRVDLGAAKRSVVHYVTPAALHANSISGCRLGTFRVSLFSFFLFIDRIFRLSLYFLLGIASSSFIRERAFLGGVSYIPEIVEKFKWRGGPFLKQKWKDPVRQFLSPPLYFSTLLDTLDVLSSLWDGFISPDTESSFVYDSPPSSSSSSSSCFLTLYVCPVCDKELTKRVAASPVATFHLAFYPTSKSRDVRDNSISPCCFSWRFPVMQSHHSHTA